MQFSSVFLPIMAALSIPAQACKCVASQPKTMACCDLYDGTYTDGDCAADSISEKLREFAACCLREANSESDCGF